MCTCVLTASVFAQALYNSLFDWVVKRINAAMFTESKNAEEELKWIGVLDVFGFECFQHNSFEQFCINLANERLQAFFNHHMSERRACALHGRAQTHRGRAVCARSRPSTAARASSGCP